MLRLLLFFQKFSIWFKILLKELANNLISLLFALSVYLTLWYFPQAIDLLLILNQTDTFFLEVPLYFTLLTISAFLIWNAPKYLYYHNYKRITFSNLIGFIPNRHYRFQGQEASRGYDYIVKIHMRKAVPRILAIMVLVISALGMLNAMELFGLKNTYTELLNPSNTLLVVVLFLLVFTEPNLYKSLRTFFYRGLKTRIFLSIIYIGLVIFIISLGTFNNQAEKGLGKLFMSNCTLALLFAIMSFNSYSILKNFSKQLFYGGILVVGFLILFLFLILNFNPLLVIHINPLSILFISFISLFMISFILILFGKKIRLPLLTIVIVVFLLFSNLFVKDSGHYYLDLDKTKIERPNMDQYIYQWIKSREHLIIDSATAFPVVLVSAEGGGSRAGLWSFLIHSYLYHKSEGRYFKENLLSLTGASGGSVGNAMFFSEARNAHLYNSRANFEMESGTAYPYLNYKASAIYKENYLSVALLSLIGRDLFKEVTGLFTFKNRGQLLEDQWRNAHNKYFNSFDSQETLSREFLSFYKDVFKDGSVDETNNIPPLLLINTTHTQTGNYNVISPVQYGHLRPLTGLNDFLSNLQSSHPNMSISLSTAMRINASFPFVTPVGEVRNNNKSSNNVDQYADAGYYDNSGGRVSNGVETIFRKILNDSFPHLVTRVKIKQLIIVNENEQLMTRRETQLTAPLATLKNIRAGHTQEIIKRLGAEYTIELKPTEITPLSIPLGSKDTESEELKITPILPVGRYLSTIAIRSIEARLQEVSKELDSILEIN